MAQVSQKSQPSISELRRSREREEMTQRIMDVAREMFVHDGYEAVTLRKIAKAVEYSPSGIYEYFRDKQSLVQAIIRADSQDLRENLLECMKLANPLDRILEMARRYADWGITHPNHYQLMLAPPPAWAEQYQQLREDEPPPLEQQMLFMLTSVVEEGFRHGLFRPEYTDPVLIASILWAGIHGIVVLEITMMPRDRALLGGKGTSFEARFQTFEQVFRNGLLRSKDS